MIYVVYGSQTGNSEEIAKRISIEIKEKFKHQKTELMVMNKFLAAVQKFPEDKSTTNIIIAVCSTTGAGDAPTNSENFIRWIKRKTHPNDTLSNTYYTILGLGDSNYTKYQCVPRLVDENLSRIGAKKFYARGEADDAYGLEAVVEPWIEGLYPVLEKLLSQIENEINLQGENHNIENIPKEERIRKNSETIGKQNEILKDDLKIENNEDFLNFNIFSKNLLSGKRSLREIYSIKFNYESTEREFNISDYTPGSHISIISPENEERLNIINQVLFINDNFLQIDKSHHFNIYSDFIEKYPHFRKLLEKGYLTTSQMLKYIIDFDSVLKKSQMENIRTLLKNKIPIEKIEIMKKFENIFQKYTEMILKNRVSLYDIISSLKLHEIKINLSLLELIESLPIKYPRNYSILSYCYEKDINPIEIVFSLCNDRIIRKFPDLKNSSLPLGFYPGEYYYKGQTTNFLKSSKENDKIFLCKIGNCFQFPIDQFLNEKKPIIYICNGTGISPCISFIKQIISMKEKLNKNTIGELILLTGFRSASEEKKESVYEDFIYESIEMINSYMGKEVITYLRCTSNCSENEEEEVGIWRNCRINTRYVQDLIIEYDYLIYEKLMSEKGYLMICGDIEKLLEECVANIISVFMQKEGNPREHWVKFIEDLKIGGKLIIEKWT